MILLISSLLCKLTPIVNVYDVFAVTSNAMNSVFLFGCVGTRKLSECYSPEPE